MEIKKFKKYSPSIGLNSPKDNDNIELLGKALSHKTRLKILNLITDKSYTITQLSNTLSLPVSNIIFHVNILEKAGLVKLSMLSNVSVVSLLTTNFHISFSSSIEKPKEILKEEYEIPVGNYIKVADYAEAMNVYDKDGNLIISIKDIYNPIRFNAELIEMSCGNLTYALKEKRQGKELEEVSISFELCSEAPFSQEDYKSEIYIMLNGKSIHKFISEGDYGSRHGNYTPNNRAESSTQYGKLYSLNINKNGVYFNGSKVASKPTISDFNFDKTVTMTIGNTEDSAYLGGLNLFGKNFGDYPQAIKIIYQYIEK